MTPRTPPTLTHVHSLLGESPVWDAPRQALWFVDIDASLLACMAWPSQVLRQWSLPEPAACIALCSSGRLLLAMKQAVFVFDPADGSLAHFVDVETDQPGNRLNDGKVAPDGSFWVGSMDDRGKSEPTGALYQIHADRRVTRRVAGLVTSNGLAWSADGRDMFHSDSRGRFIKRYRYALGELDDETVIASPDAAQGRPDGGATDEQGHYWSAGVSAGCLNRFSRTGTLLERLALPVAHPTMPCFGGPGLELMFVTSLVLDDAEASGRLLYFTPGVRGVPVALFPI